MNHPINQQEFSDNSSDYEHPNIEKGTLKRLIREKKQREKDAKMKELENIERQLKMGYNPELIEKKHILEEKLKPKFVETENFTLENKPTQENLCDDYTEQFLFLGSEPTIENFINFVENNRKINLESFNDFLLINLAENIKEGYDEVGLVISKLTLFFKYLKEGGSIDVLKKMSISLENPEKKMRFEQECKEYYEDSKKAILGCQSSQ